MSSSDFLASPYHRLLGIEMIRMEAGEAELRLPVRDELLRSDGSDWLHGGVVAALIDIAGNAAIFSATGVGVPTVDMRVDYLRPAKGHLTASAKAVKAGRSIGVSDVEVRDMDQRLVAVGRAVYAIRQSQDSKPEPGNRS
jgi:uncharacterized protein (TIGR00369 family)